MRFETICVVGLSLLAATQSCFGGPIPKDAPTAAQIADAMNLPRATVKIGPANIDPILAKDHGVRWRYYYRLSSKPGHTLVIAVLSPKYLPKANEALGEPEKANPPPRNSIAPNGDVLNLFASPIPDNCLQHVARLERHDGDWDLLVTIFPDKTSPPENPAMLGDAAMKNLVEKTAQILSQVAAK